MEALSIVAIVISGVALILSGYTLWTMHLKPFEIKVEIGSPILAPANVSEETDMLDLSLILPMNFVNIGARGGTINDMLIRLDTESAKYPSWFLHPYFFASEYSEKALKERHREVVHPIYFQGKEKIFRNIIFTPIPERDFPLLRLSDPILPAGKYSLTLSLLDSSSTEFRQMQQLSFELVKDVYGGFIPRDLKAVEARNRLFGSILKKGK